VKLSQVAVQSYTIREFFNNPQNITSSLKKLKAIGYDAIQISFGAEEWMPIADLKSRLDAEGLICCATHDSGELILNRPEELVEKLQKLDCQQIAYPYPAGLKLDTREDVEKLAAALNKAGQVFAQAGITLTYHNHALEFRHYDGQTMLEIIYEKTDPRYVQGEIDTYWVQAGGGDPAEWCSRLKNRLPLLHIKDYVINQENKPIFAEIGYGNLNFRRIVDAADQSGCQWFIVEQDVCPGDPFDSLAKSFNYIKERLCTP
jgi:sugar phosphate isomerase/epimerase